MLFVILVSRLSKNSADIPYSFFPKRKFSTKFSTIKFRKFRSSNPLIVEKPEIQVEDNFAFAGDGIELATRRWKIGAESI